MATKARRIYNWAMGRQLMSAEYDHAKEVYQILEEVFELSGYEVKSHKVFRMTLKPILMIYVTIGRLFWFIRKVTITHHTIIDASNDLVVFATQIPYKLGYDTDECMNETLKEIGSRVQDPQQAFEWERGGAHGKWQKSLIPRDVKRWKKADYSKCLLKDK